MALLPAIEINDEDKLDVLRRLDQFRNWNSLDDKRYCLSCGRIITGHQIKVIGGTRGLGPLRIICATDRCPSIPMDWVLPTDEVLAKSCAAAVPAAHIERVVPGSKKTIARKGPIGASLRKFATHFHRPA
jgi:hypothetical protein